MANSKTKDMGLVKEIQKVLLDDDVGDLFEDLDAASRHPFQQFGKHYYLLGFVGVLLEVLFEYYA